MVKVSESEEEYIIEIPHKNDFDLLIFTRENLGQLGLFAKITVKPKEPSFFGSFFSGGSAKSDDLTIPYKWFHDILVRKNTSGHDVTAERENESETVALPDESVPDESVNKSNNKLNLDYFMSFFKPTKGETNSTPSTEFSDSTQPPAEIVKIEPEPIVEQELIPEIPEESIESPPVQKIEESIESSPVQKIGESIESDLGETSITIRIKKIGSSKLVKLKDQIKDIYDAPRTIEVLDETGINYILLEKITFDLYKQFETLVQVHIVPTELNPEYIYKINGIYVYLDNSKMKMINDDIDSLTRRNKVLFNTFIDELKFGETGTSENKINVIENTRIEKVFGKYVVPDSHSAV